MKKVLLGLLLLAGTAYTSSATFSMSVALEKGIWSTVGGCDGDKGICKVAAQAGVSDGTLYFDDMTGNLWLEVPAGSDFYGSLSESTVEYEDNSYLPQDVSAGLGFGAAQVYIPMGVYSVTDEGSKIVQLSYVIEE